MLSRAFPTTLKCPKHFLFTFLIDLLKLAFSTAIIVNSLNSQQNYVLSIEQKLGNVLNNGEDKAKEEKDILGKYKCIYYYLNISFNMLSKTGMQ